MGNKYYLQMKFAAALIATVAANRYESMNEDDLLVNLSTELSSALSSEARGDADAAVAKTAAIKNIQKALTARILKRLDDGQPLVEVARKMKAIEGMQPQINDMERRLGIMQSVEPVLENAIKTPRRSSMSEEWARNDQHRPFDAPLNQPEGLDEDDWFDPTIARRPAPHSSSSVCDLYLRFTLKI